MAACQPQKKNNNTNIAIDMTCLQTAFIAVAGDDAHSRAVDTGADESVHVVVAQVFDLKIIRLRNTKQTAGGNKKKFL